MKKSLAFLALALVALASCKKERGDISLTASTTQAKVGQNVTVTLNGDASSATWTVSPADNVTQGTLTTAKVTSYAFAAVGDYTITARAAEHGRHHGDCHHDDDDDAASITIHVTAIK